LYEAYFPWHTNMQLYGMLVRKVFPIVILVPLRSDHELVDFSFGTDVGKYRIAQYIERSLTWALFFRQVKPQ
jgi:hypothetical protein